MGLMVLNFSGQRSVNDYHNLSAVAWSGRDSFKPPIHCQIEIAY